MESGRKYKIGETNEIAQTGMEEAETCRKITISKGHQGPKKKIYNALAASFFFFFFPHTQNQEVMEQMTGDIKLSADVTEIAGVFKSCFASISLRR